jgi:uncharacterized protein YdaU (DUF1376 family)
MAESLAMMPWFPSDFLAATRGWSVTATGVYRALLDAQWELGALPEDPSELRALIHATPKEWADGWKRCESKFPIVAGARQNQRLEEHRVKALQLQDRRRRGAIATNAKRWANGGDEDSLSDRSASRSDVAQRVGERSHPSPSPSEDSEKNPAARAIGPDSELDPEAYLIWTAGLDLIGKDKRSLLGLLVKQHGSSAVASKISEVLAMPDRPQDPAAYLVAAMKRTERRFVC